MFGGVDLGYFVDGDGFDAHVGLNELVGFVGFSCPHHFERIIYPYSNLAIAITSKIKSILTFMRLITSECTILLFLNLPPIHDIC